MSAQNKYQNISNEELIELEKLQREQEIYERRQSLLVPEHENHTKNYTFLQNQRLNRKYNDKGELIEGTNIEVLEGSARSSKTFSIIDEIIRICIFEIGRTIFIIRETYNEIKTTLYKDFKERLDYFGLENPFNHKEEVKSFKINSSRITFLGADKIGRKLGAGSDYLYFNEVLHGINEHVFRQLVTRCSIATFCDYNPSFTEHWFYNKVLKRKNCGYLRTTYLDNKYCPPIQRAEIESSEPWLPGSYMVINDEIFYNFMPISDTNQPPPHPENIEQGTADDFYWRVFGLGLRGAMKGRIFKTYKILDYFPDVDFCYGMDFGFTVDPLAFGKYAETKTDIYIQPLIYEPIADSQTINQALIKLNVDRSKPIIADSSDRYVSGKNGVVNMVSDLFDLGWNISKVSKNKSVMYWLGSMKKKRINIVRSKTVNIKHATSEIENYRLKEVGGITIEQPADSPDHIIDFARYCHMAQNQINFSPKIK